MPAAEHAATGHETKPAEEHQSESDGSKIDPSQPGWIYAAHQVSP
jgi:hypothetical protein